MSARALVIAFRYKLLLLVPFLIAVPAAVAFVFLTGDSTYQAQAKVSTQRPAIPDVAETRDWNPYLSAAQNQAVFFRQALQTNVFTERVADRASDGFHRVMTRDDVRAGAWVAESGSTLLTVGFNHGDPDVAVRVVTALVEEYALLEREQTLAEFGRAEDLYQLQVDALSNDLRGLRNELAQQISGLPDDALAETVPSIAALRSEIDARQDEHGDALRSLISTQQYIAQAESGEGPTFQLVDAAERPSTPIARSRVQLFGPPALAFLLALAVSAAVFAFLYQTDSTLRSLEDFSLLPGVRPLGMVPEAATTGTVTSIRQFTRSIMPGGGRPASGG